MTAAVHTAFKVLTLLLVMLLLLSILQLTFRRRLLLTVERRTSPQRSSMLTSQQIRWGYLPRGLSCLSDGFFSFLWLTAPHIWSAQQYFIANKLRRLGTCTSQQHGHIERALVYGPVTSFCTLPVACCLEVSIACLQFCDRHISSQVPPLS